MKRAEPCAESQGHGDKQAAACTADGLLQTDRVYAALVLVGIIALAL